MKASYWLLVAAAFVFCSAFSTDSAGRACVKAKGERGASYDIYKTKVTDAYTPGGRRLLQDGHRIYEIVVPALVKRDKPITCTMSLAEGKWAAPGIGAVERGLAAGNAPLSGDEERRSNSAPFTVREMRAPDWR